MLVWGQRLLLVVGGFWGWGSAGGLVCGLVWRLRPLLWVKLVRGLVWGLCGVVGGCAGGYSGVRMVLPVMWVWWLRTRPVVCCMGLLQRQVC